MNAVVSSKIKLVTIEDQTIIMDVEGGKYYCCNRIGGLILEMLLKNATVSQIVATLQEKYNRPEAATKIDVDSFLRGLEGKSLCKIIPAGT